MIHKHRFVRVSGCEKPRPNGASIHSVIEGSLFVCMELDCDATRRVWPDGSKDVIKEGLPDQDE